MTEPPHRTTRLRRLALAPVPLLLLLGLLELCLAVFGLAPRDSLDRGFDPGARYLVPDPEVPGGHVTRIYVGEVQRDEVRIPAKGSRRRVLLMGGSNTRYFPERYLQRVLERDAPPGHPGFEVVNLGREGYGSERVAILLDQALAALSPDAVVIYSGHNEFIEQRFSDELDVAMQGPWSWLHRHLMPLRTYGLARSLATPARSDPQDDDPDTPEQWTLASREYAQLRWTGTQRYLRAYDQNLRRMCTAALDAGCELVLCTLPGNDVTPPVSTMEPLELDDDALERVLQLNRLELLTHPESPFRPLASGRTLRRPFWYAEAPRDLSRTAPALRPLSGFLAEAPATEGPPPSEAGSHWPPPRFWNTRVAETLEAYRLLLARGLEERQLAWLTQRREDFVAALEIIPDDPAALFNLGLCAWLLDADMDTCTRLLRRASARDRVQLSASDTINELIRQVAADDPRLELLDVDAAVRACVPHGLIGYEVMLDHSHLQPGVATAVMDLLAERLEPGADAR